MKKITQGLLVGLVFCLLAVALAFLTSRPAPAQLPPPPVPVTVVNGTARPVPTSAQGTTTVAGSVAALQGGPWRVHVINALDASSNPVPLIVQDLNSAPFTLSTSCNGVTAAGIPVPCEPGFPQQPNITLPTGSGASVRAVVIDFVSGSCIGLASSTIPLFPFQVFGPNTNTVAGQNNVGLFAFPGVPLTGSPQNGGIPGSNQSWFAQQTRIYAQPGSSVVLLVGVNTGCALSVSGHLI
jgi:hypothetical protein